ncbi:MAG: nitrate- and nitrite sensing domain-containing protein [Flavobacteriales bacterium]|nr:nitrate- and nitrite sensing domain-containing protein [Flavobacteriales bacterium]
MNWRFADFPIRTKFLVTLGIPVLGLVLLIGKQVDSNLKRSRVLGYVAKQSGSIRAISDVVDAMQYEGAVSVATLEKVLPGGHYLQLARAQSDARMARLGENTVAGGPMMRASADLQPLDGLRRQVDGRSIAPALAELGFRSMNEELVRNLAEMSRQAVDQDVNNRMFAHQSLLYAKESLSDIRMLVLRGLASGITQQEQEELYDRIALYETSLFLFKRDASPDMQTLYRNTFQGPDVNFLRFVLSTVTSKRSVANLGTDAARWWEVSGRAMLLLRAAEEQSIDSIIRASKDVSRDAQRRLVLVLAALLIVVGAVAVMAMVIMRGLRSTINEVTHAAAALAQGDVRGNVPVRTRDEVGQMAGSFNKMIGTIRSLSASADAIGQGNYDASVLISGEQDVLGHSLTRMRDNLKSARQRDLEYNQVLFNEKEKLEQANARIETLIREIHHRVKNNLQLVSSMLRLQSGTIADERLQQALSQTQSRVASMALLHEKLYKGSDLAQLNLAQYIRDLFSELVLLNKVQEKIRYRTAIDPDLALDMDTLVPLGLILNELITNSFKHAFSPGEGGFINLRVHRAGEQEFDLNYSDDGKGIPLEKQDQPSDTLGRSLISSLVEQLNGTLSMESDETGTRYHIRFRTAHRS